MRRLLPLFLLFLVFISLPTSVMAAKTRVRKPRATQSSLSYSSVTISPNTHSIILDVKNLSSVDSITYELSYKSWDMPQGAVGKIAVSGQTTDSRSLYFGTCSHGVCTAHYGLSSASLLVCTSFKNGTEWCKRYTIGTKRLQ